MTYEKNKKTKRNFCTLLEGGKYEGNVLMYVITGVVILAVIFILYYLQYTVTI